MIEKLLAEPFENVRLHHVRMAFSEEIGEVGKLRIGKVAHLGSVLARIARFRVRRRADVLYYPPAGADRIPVVRDVVILLATRWMFPHTVFHFHAGGLTDLLPSLNPLARRLFLRAYSGPDCAIQLSELNPPDGDRLQARRTAVIPYGVEDMSPEYPRQVRAPDAPVRLLYVGAVRRSKGISDLVEACGRLRSRGVAFRLELVGQSQPASYAQELSAVIAKHGLEQQVFPLGELSGPDKWRAYARADIFCFPSFYEKETFGVVLLEAMQFGLPVVATRWRGIPSIVIDGTTGHLVPVNDPECLAETLQGLVEDPAAQKSFGEAGRARFLAEFSIGRWRERMERVFQDVAASR